MNALHNLRISTKLIVSFAAVLALCIFLGSFSIIQLSRVNQASTDMQVNWMPSVEVLLEMKFDLAAYRTLELQHILATTDEPVFAAAALADRGALATRQANHPVSALAAKQPPAVHCVSARALPPTER